MVLNIKDDATDRAVRELARATGESITVATRVAAEERLARVRAAVRRHPPRTREIIGAIMERGARRPVRDDRPEDEILGYGVDGLPQ